MAISTHKNSIWDTVLELTKTAQQKGTDPFLWAIQISSNLNSVNVSLPSIELSHTMVSYIFWDNNVPSAWKFLEKALMLNMVPPLLVLALLSTRVIPCRHSRPTGYRLYMEFLKRYAFKLKSQISVPDFGKVMMSIEHALCLSQIFGSRASEPNVLLVEFVFTIMWQLLDALLDDEGLLELTTEKKSFWAITTQEMDIDPYDNYDEKKFEQLDKLRRMNTEMAFEIIGQFFQNGVTSRMICLVRHNMPKQWAAFTERLELLATNSLTSRNPKILCPKMLLELTSGARKFSSWKYKKSEEFSGDLDFISLASPAHGQETSHSGLWLPLDIILEDVMDGSQVTATSAVEIITGLVKSLQGINNTSWYDTFLALWIGALRFVQRERDPMEGPVPCLDTRMCVLLSITPLVVADLIDEEENPLDESESKLINNWNKRCDTYTRRKDLVSCLQILGDYQSLLSPPQSVVPAANLAAAKAMMFVSGIDVSGGYFECINVDDLPTNCAGNMRHLIVEACIARNLLDTSAYFWPGYVNGQINQFPSRIPSQVPGWSSFMQGASLRPVMINSMVVAPASSLAELEKVFELAMSGSEDEKIYAATILCGASLLQGWNVQEHTVSFITRLLSPPVPADFLGNDSHLIAYAPMLFVLLVGIAPVDCVQIFSLHGLVPQLAASLMTICEVFGSCVPNVSWTVNEEEISAHAVFSNAFALLLKLWRFNHPPLDYGVGDVPPVGSQLTPEYLLLVRNALLSSAGYVLKDRNKRRLSAVFSASCPKPIFVDSFPKLKVWYRQHQACIAAPLSGLIPESPVHQIVEVLLNMIFRKINKGVQSSATSGSSNSSGPASEDSSLRPQLPAWDILEAVPYVVDAALSACAHGQVTPRELATGLKDLADFLPASLATIVSYFSAEVTRGIWKPALMNGTDWPSPAANLSNVEEQIKKILAATGVDVPSLAAVNSPATLPLPLAAFLSLTITYKLDKVSQRFLNLAGPALESLAADCPWPCMPIVASLWTQKAKRWSDFLVFSASRTVFLHDNNAVVQLLRSCFTTTLGLSTNPSSSRGGVAALLGHGFGSHFNGGISPVAPGILYLRVYRSVREIMYLAEEIIFLLMQSVREIVGAGISKQSRKKLKRTKIGPIYGQVSLDVVMTKVKLAASLAATLLWLSGGQCLVQCLLKETLPSWFISVQRSALEEESEEIVSTFRGHALAYFAVLCGAFAWGVDSSSPASKRRPRILGQYLEFLASALDGKISLGCDSVVWKAYVSRFINLMVGCTPNWVVEMDVNVLMRLSDGLIHWKEEDIAFALLTTGGMNTMGAAAKLIVESER
ncbi:mediator of RNA polymerase II transcription subunit 33A-like isoform X2 [Chenopodium quinoa]|uniref:mediator of RNA polymerase II transcription subunit 33A-like isoform X2 n=1 Tax=Chenopodium quinoa TaxID=63459 RepID=UPI000B79AD1C|nr:mediator of RNA polymerase II transcription subunit 33A-like isoform X2 [Chenopodium quinoa]